MPQRSSSVQVGTNLLAAFVAAFIAWELDSWLRWIFALAALGFAGYALLLQRRAADSPAPGAGEALTAPGRGREDGPFPGVYGDFAICREMKTLSDHYRRMGAEVLSATSPRPRHISLARSRPSPQDGGARMETR